MADNTTVKDGLGTAIVAATDQLADLSQSPKVSVLDGTGSATPISPATSGNQTAQSTLIGAVTETAPATDTASSGLNGRLQRIAQRITSFIALIPASLGQKTKASAFAVTLASDEDLLTTLASQTTAASINTYMASAVGIMATEITQGIGNTYLGALTETAPASDTASSGLNGRLQRIAQRITSLIALIPASLGQKVMASSLATTIASDQSDLPIKPGSTETKISAATMPSGGVGFLGWLSSIWYQLSLVAPAATGTQSIVAGSASDVTILASNTARKGATVYNDSTAALYLLVGSGTSSATVFTVTLQPADYYEVPYRYTGVLKGIWASAVGSARVTEFT